MQIQQVNIDILKPYALNAKKHPPKQIAAIAESIKRFGWKQPLVIESNHTLIAGHGRLEAAKHLGLSEAPCVVADDLTEAEIRAFRILDNKVSEGEWDEELLQADLSTIDFNFASFEFEAQEIEPFSVESVDDSHNALIEVVTAPGDVWVMGHAKLRCATKDDETKEQLLFDPAHCDLVVKRWQKETGKKARLGHNGKTFDEMS
jgi:hypothetical protein